MPSREASPAPRIEANRRASVLVIDNFLPAALAEAMRGDIDRHFGDPYAHRPESHQVWNYWFVPGLYTYLRTAPERVIRRERVQDFFDSLRAWSISALGLAGATWPFLSLYIHGCRQTLHNDARNGRFGFVYSLTSDGRRSSGGDTLILREHDVFRTNLATPAAGANLYETVAPRFNRLVVFDDRLLHAVSPVEGPMDPIEGRIVLHGHLREEGNIIRGALPPAVVAKSIGDMLARFTVHAAARLALYRGVLGLRLVVAPAGGVEECAILSDRVLHPDAGDTEWEPLRRQLMDGFADLKFPGAPGKTEVVLPVAFGGPLPAS